MHNKTLGMVLLGLFGAGILGVFAFSTQPMLWLTKGISIDIYFLLGIVFLLHFWSNFFDKPKLLYHNRILLFFLFLLSATQFMITLFFFHEGNLVSLFALTNPDFLFVYTMSGTLFFCFIVALAELSRVIRLLGYTFWRLVQLIRYPLFFLSAYQLYLATYSLPYISGGSIFIFVVPVFLLTLVQPIGWGARRKRQKENKHKGEWYCANCKQTMYGAMFTHCRYCGSGTTSLEQKRSMEESKDDEEKLVCAQCGIEQEDFAISCKNCGGKNLLKKTDYEIHKEKKDMEKTGERKPGTPPPIYEKVWQCAICNYVVEKDEKPNMCPMCHSGKEVFERKLM